MHRLRKPKKQPLPKGEDGFGKTRAVLQKILRIEFHDSLSTLAEKLGYSLTLVYRVLHAERPPTPELVGSFLRVSRSKTLGVELLAAFLRDTAASISTTYIVELEVRR